jgi:hypothetical protein
MEAIMPHATDHTRKQQRREEPEWTRNEVPRFLNEFFRGAATLSQLVAAARRRFPNRKPLQHMEVDRYIAVFVLDVLRIVTWPKMVDSLLSAETPRGQLGNLTRP